MIDQLFGSKTRVKLLQLFYSNPNRSFYVREITRNIDEQINSVRRELSNLLGIGIIVSTTNNNRLYYEVNQDFEYFSPLTEIFGDPSQLPKSAKKTDKATKESESELEPVNVVTPQKESPMAQKLRQAGRVDLAMLTGQFTRDESAGIDLLVVGDVNQTQMGRVVGELEEQERKSIRYVTFTTDEFEYRQQINDRFVGTLLLAKKQILINDKSLKTEA